MAKIDDLFREKEELLKKKRYASGDNKARLEKQIENIDREIEFVHEKDESSKLQTLREERKGLKSKKEITKKTIRNMKKNRVLTASKPHPGRQDIYNAF